MTSTEFRQLRDRLGLSQAELGRLMGLSRKVARARADELIGLLEFMQGGISGSGLPVKDACASVRAIEDGADALAHLVDRLPEGDPFRDIMNRIVITASVEAIKFRRGDYQ